jgi:hypothetical protein
MLVVDASVLFEIVADTPRSEALRAAGSVRSMQPRHSRR